MNKHRIIEPNLPNLLNKIATLEGNLCSIIFMFEPIASEEGLKASMRLHDHICEVYDDTHSDEGMSLQDGKDRLVILLEECLAELRKE